MISKIDESLFKLINYIENQNYHGYDPYDALSSPLFTLPVLRNNYAIRFLSQQFIKRFPFNLRPLLGINKSMNPVTLGLCLSGYVNIMRSTTKDNSSTNVKCLQLIENLIHKIPEGYTETCWGYDFPWQSKHFTLDALQPSIVASGIISNGLFEYYRLTKDETAIKHSSSVCDFILNKINHIEKGPEKICFSYTPYDRYCVYNAAMKGVRVLSQVYSVTRNHNLIELVTKVVNYVTAQQNNDGSWYYAEGNKGKWIDNYHTGYILDSLYDYIQYSGNNQFNEYYRKGLNYYVNTFITHEGIPKFYNNSTYPVDCTAAAQTILTLCKNNLFDDAVRVANYMIKHMQDSNGSFYYRFNGKKTNKISFMRWSDAWMFYALSKLSSNLKSVKPAIDY